MDKNKVGLLTEQVNTILYLYWDPIGCGVPSDEYEVYAHYIVTHFILNNKNDINNNFNLIASYLMMISREWMGIGEYPVKAEKASKIIIERYL